MAWVGLLRCRGRLPLVENHEVRRVCPFIVDMYATCAHGDDMSIMIQIRNVPDVLHRRAKAKAALEGVTLSDLALRALEAEVKRLSVDEVVARVRELGPVYGAPPAAALIREERDTR